MMRNSNVVVIGLASDPVIVNFIARSRLLGYEPSIVDLGRLVATGQWRLHAPGRRDDWLSYDQIEVRIGGADGIYARLIDLSLPGSEGRASWTGLLAGLRAHLQLSEAVVINRPFSDSHNSSKQIHEAWLAGKGLLVPESVTSADKEVLAEFCTAGRTIAKPLSGVRANAREVAGSDFGDDSKFRGPVHLQRYVPGNDVRAHVVGNEVLCCGFSGTGVDYRRDNKRIEWVTELDCDLSDLVVALTAEQGLVFAGWDFKIDAEGRAWCLEANPMPGYSFYDRIMNGAITKALLAELYGERELRSPGLTFGSFPPEVVEHSSVESSPSMAVSPRELQRICQGHITADCCSESCELLVKTLEAGVMSFGMALNSGLPVPSLWQCVTRREMLGYGTRSEGNRYRRCLEWILRESPHQLNMDFLLEVHDRGIGGRDFRSRELPIPTRRSCRVADIEERVSKSLECLNVGVMPSAAGRLHLDLLEIHPFPDGNGRVARLVATAILVRCGFRSSLVLDIESLFFPELADYTKLLYRFHDGSICSEKFVARWLNAILKCCCDVARLWPIPDCGTRSDVSGLDLAKLSSMAYLKNRAGLVRQIGKRLDELEPMHAKEWGEQC